MLAFLPWLRKELLFRTHAARSVNFVFSSLGPAALCLVFTAFCLTLSTAAPAGIVMETGGKTMRLNNSGAYESTSPDAAATTPPRQSNATGEKQEDRDGWRDLAPLPYGIVPEVHVPWSPRQNDRPPRPERPGHPGGPPRPGDRPGYYPDDHPGWRPDGRPGAGHRPDGPGYSGKPPHPGGSWGATPSRPSDGNKPGRQGGGRVPGGPPPGKP
jgi:hypothetical protein